MKLGSRSVALPLVGFAAAGTTVTVAIVLGAVLVVFALLACMLILAGGVAPWMQWGPFKLGFQPLQNGSRHPGQPSTVPERPGLDPGQQSLWGESDGEEP